MAVRHGWLSGGEGNERPPDPCSRPSIDVAAFVRSVLTPDGECYQVSPAFGRELEGLPGFDANRGVVRLVDDPDAEFDTAIYPGRSHPLVRRAIASVRTGRVSAVKGHTLSLLLTYVVEAGPHLRSIFALRLFPDGSILEEDLSAWLEGEPADPDGLWQKSFACWAPDAMVSGRSYAAEVAERIGTTASTRYQEQVDRQENATRVWLTRRATELCGPVQRWGGDLFEPQPSSNDWQYDREPQRRLASFAADASIPLPQRREAADALSKFSGKPPALPRPVLRTLGMLMLTA
jgi:hypothetical protein